MTIKDNNHQHLKILMNICTLISSIFAIIISSFIINYILVNVLRKKHLKQTSNISLLLTCNTCLAIICSCSTMTLMSLSSLSGDLNIRLFKPIIHWCCYVRGYLHFVFINSIYLSYVLQAGFRLCRIAFHDCRCLRTIYSFSIYIFLQWFSSFLLISPLLIVHHNHLSLIVYLPNEFYCQVPLNNIRGIIFSILTVYFVPLCSIGIVYIWIIRHIRFTNRFTLIIFSIQRQNKRDGIILKRICLVVVVLLSLGIPSCLFVISNIITGHLHWAAYRVGWMTISISFALISLSSIYVTPQIYRPIRNMIQHSIINLRNRNSYSSSTNNNIGVQRKSSPYVNKNKM